MSHRRDCALGIALAGLVAALSISLPALADEYRGVWADAFHDGFRDSGWVTTMVTDVARGRYNVLIPQVIAYVDSSSSQAHGAFWHSSVVARAPSATGGFDPLQDIITKAHGNNPRIQVEAWIFPFRFCVPASDGSGGYMWPTGGPTVNAPIPQNGSWCIVPYANRGCVSSGGVPALFTGSGATGQYWLDPCSPDVQEYYVRIVRELARFYDIDGIHWDYEPGNRDNWYPADLNYTNSGVARFRRIVRDAMPGTLDSDWAAFRRRCINEFMARCFCEMRAIKPNLRQCASLIANGSGPPTSCSDSAYYGSASYLDYADFREWLRNGYIDFGVPMIYNKSTNSWFDRFDQCWNVPVTPRPTFPGLGGYLQPKEDTKREIAYVIDTLGMGGTAIYSYANPTNTSGEDYWTYIAANRFTSTANVPSMPWRTNADGSEGTVWGRVLNGGVPVDNATVTATGRPSVQTDGNGYFVYTMLPAAIDTGTSYTLTVSKGTGDDLTDSVTVTRGGLVRKNFQWAPYSPIITVQPVNTPACPSGNASISVTATGDGTLSYHWQKNGTDLGTSNPHYSNVDTATLTINGVTSGDSADFFSCRITNAYGEETTDWVKLVIGTTTAITAQPQNRGVCRYATDSFAVTAVGDNLTYQWFKGATQLTNGGHYSNVATPTLTVTGIDTPDVSDEYHCVVTGDCGTVSSANASLSLAAITSQPISRVACPGTPSVSFTVAASGTSLTYQWAKNGYPMTNGGHYSGVTTPTLVVTNPDSSDVAVYRCMVKGCLNSDLANLTLGTAPSITTHPTGGTFCPGTSTDLTVGASGSGLSYRWQKGGTNLDDGGHYSGVTTATLTIAGIDSGDAGNYTCVVSNDCGSVTSNAATVTVDEAVCPHVSILEWYSLWDHNGYLLGIQLDQSGTPGGPTLPTLEPRGTGLQMVALIFDSFVTLQNSAAVTVTSGTESYEPSVSVDADLMYITFSPPLPSGKCYTITIGADAIEELMQGDTDCIVRVLSGDATQNGAINLGDALYIKSKIGLSPDVAANLDINVDGAIDMNDVLAAKAAITSAGVVCP